jgi:hypothetical protein
MVEGWRGLENLKFGTLSEFGKCVAVMSTRQKPVQDRPTQASLYIPPFLVVYHVFYCTSQFVSYQHLGTKPDPIR